LAVSHNETVFASSSNPSSGSSLGTGSGTAPAGIPKPIAYYFFASLFLWACCLVTIGYWRFIAHRPAPYNTLRMPAPLFRDLWCYHAQFVHLHSPDFFKYTFTEMFPYPPGSAFPFAVFNNLLPHFHTIPYLVITLLGIATLVSLFVKRLRELDVKGWRLYALSVAPLLLMFPFQFVYTTGNIEIVLFLLLIFGVLAFLRGHFVTAAILIGFCASMKMYPFVLIALFIPVRRYREMALAAVTFVVSIVGGLWLMCPDIPFAWRASREALQINRMEMMQNFLFIQTAADHSIWGLVKTIAYVLTKHQHHSSKSVTAYLGVMALAGIMMYFGRIRKLPLLNQIVCLYLCLLLLVPESFEYTLIHLALPWALLVLYTIHQARQHLSLRGLTPVFLCFAFVLSAENELVFHYGYWGPAKCVGMLVLLALALTQPWRYLEDADWIALDVRNRLRSTV